MTDQRDQRIPARIAVTSARVMRAMPALRYLFRLLGYDTSGFTDAAIADSLLLVCPVFDESWPTDAQLNAVFQRLHELADSGSL